MLNGALIDILALVPTRMQIDMSELATVAPGRLNQFTSIEKMIHDSADRSYVVVFITATGFSIEEWWRIWGFLNDKDPHPCIIAYALRSEFELWSSVLDAGAFDLIVAPFTKEKLRRAILSALDEFARRSAE